MALANSFSRARSAWRVSNMLGPAPLDLVLRRSRPKRFGEVAPERVETMVGHLEDAADVRRLLLVEGSSVSGVFP